MKKRHPMKRFFWLFMLFVLLAACSPDGSGAECKEGICVRITIDGPAQALEPVPFTVSVQSDKDITGLGISIMGGPLVTILDLEKTPDKAVLGYQDERNMSWQINTTGGKEYVFLGHAIFAKPPQSYGIFSYGIFVTASHPLITRVDDFVAVYMDADGKQVDEAKAKSEPQNELLAPTPPPDSTIVPETPMPTVDWPSETPLPSQTPTLPAYPVPDDKASTADAGKDRSLPTPTLPAYPNP